METHLLQSELQSAWDHSWGSRTMANQLPAQAVSKTAPGKHGNVLPLWGNEKTMNLNPMILTNVLSSPYFKVQLYELKTYHEVVDEIYFKVNRQSLTRMLGTITSIALVAVSAGF